MRMGLFLKILFFMQVNPKTMYLPILAVPVGAFREETGGGEIMSARAGCREFTASLSVGALPIYPLYFSHAMLQMCHPDNEGNALQ